MLDETISRIYNTGWSPKDHVEIRQNSVLLTPVKPPKSTGLIDVSTVDVRGIHCLLYKVVAVGEQTEPSDIKVNVGDLVVIRMMYVDPIHPNEEMLQTATKHILSVVERAKGSLVI